MGANRNLATMFSLVAVGMLAMAGCGGPAEPEDEGDIDVTANPPAIQQVAQPLATMPGKTAGQVVKVTNTTVPSTTQGGRAATIQHEFTPVPPVCVTCPDPLMPETTPER